MISQSPPVMAYEAVLGQVLKGHRETRNLDQEGMAKRVGVTQPYWSRVELGRANPSNAVLRKAGEVLGIPHAELLAQVDRVCQEATARGVRVVTANAKEASTAEGENGDDWVPVVAMAAIATLIVLVLTKKK